MPDREKVIKALTLCKYDPDPGQELKHIKSCAHCPYWNNGIAPACSSMYTDAIALIKEQDNSRPCDSDREFNYDWCVHGDR